MIYTYRIVECQTCGKEFLVERLLIGTDHTSGIIVSCKDCLPKDALSEAFTKEHPEESKQIQKWLAK